MLFFLYYRDAVIGKKLRIYETSIDALNREVYKLRKEQRKYFSSENLDIDEEVKGILSKELSAFTAQVLDSIKEIRISQEEALEKLQYRLEHLEEKTKEYMAVPSSMVGLDEKRVISLFHAGYSTEDIARELRANISEVAFILKLNNLSL